LDQESHAEWRDGRTERAIQLDAFAGTAEGVRRQHGRPRTPDGYRLLMRKILLRNRFVLDEYVLRILRAAPEAAYPSAFAKENLED
jgi:hypothetical protein